MDRDDIKGSWRLDNISYEGVANKDNLRITLLEEGTDACLKGSTWTFPNNGNGTYTISDGASGCVSGERNIVWSYRTEGGQPILQYKRISGGAKPSEIKDGYRFKVISADGATLQLQSEVSFEGRPLYINYSFTKL